VLGLELNVNGVTDIPLASAPKLFLQCCTQWIEIWAEWRHRYPTRFCSEIISPMLYPMNRDMSSFCRNNRDTWRCHICAYSATWHPATFSSERDGICLLAHYLYIVNNVIVWAINLLPIAQRDATPAQLILKWRWVSTSAAIRSLINIKVNNILQYQVYNLIKWNLR
jgi:hypothetical protein